MTVPVNGRGKNWRSELIDTPDGRMTRKEAAERSGLPRGTIARRVWSGWAAKHLFDPPARHEFRLRKPAKPRKQDPFVTPYGLKTLAEMADIIGVSAKALHTRLTAYGWSEEDTFKTPRSAPRRSRTILPPDEYRLQVKLVISAGRRGTLS